MASRRDELNAYTFAKRRLVASFLQPSPSGTEEGAPRPLQAVVPGVIVAALLVAGFGAWGMFKPTAPQGWDEPASKVIVGSDSTTRYVVLKTGKHKMLHPVLNLASARLMLKTDDFKVVNVDDKVLDDGKIPRGPTLGIPYAPDRLPTSEEAKKAKRWAVCEQQGQGGRDVQKATFVFADKEANEVEGAQRLHGGDVMYVRGPGRKLYMVDASGTKYPLDPNEGLLRSAVGSGEPQQVSNEWLATLKTGDGIHFPTVTGAGAPADVPGSLESDAKRVGMVLQAPESGSGAWHHYVVLKDRVAPISDFMAQLLLASEGNLGQNNVAKKVTAGSFTRSGEEFGGHLKWPDHSTKRVNYTDGTQGGRDTVCNVLRKVDGKNNTTLSTWAGTAYPHKIADETASTYVTPGSGLLFRQVQGHQTKTGLVFLLTDSGLRYGVQSNSDSGTDKSRVGSDGKKASEKTQEQQVLQTQKRLGYEGVTPVPVPAEWSQFLSTGPRLDVNSARQPQGS
ncbi:type VII secretion protein EccB [Streptomyces sp. NPDC047117]|uniref:type VII secretion protein EccB n=1 Tax=Streptomyces sp. NPDC047117 TaxID=3155379 RepID=UPI0034054BFD